MSVLLAKRLLSVAEYHKMAEVGILQPADRVELLNGEIIKMSPIGSKHAGYLSIIDELLRDVLGKKVQINNQSAIRLSKHSEPEPDLSILKRRDDFYINKLPTAKDVFLVVEVADSTLEKDRQVKSLLYANAGIPEYWILNIPERQMECYTNPQDGVYQEYLIIKGKESITFNTFEVYIEAKDIFILGKGK